MPTLGWAQRTCGHWSHGLQVTNSGHETNTRHDIHYTPGALDQKGTIERLAYMICKHPLPRSVIKEN